MLTLFHIRVYLDQVTVDIVYLLALALELRGGGCPDVEGLLDESERFGGAVLYSFLFVLTLLLRWWVVIISI